MTQHIDTTIAHDIIHLETCNTILRQLRERYHDIQPQALPHGLIPFGPYQSLNEGGITIESAPDQVDVYGTIQDTADAALVYSIIDATRTSILDTQRNTTHHTNRATPSDGPMVSYGKGFGS